MAVVLLVVSGAAPQEQPGLRVHDRWAAERRLIVEGQPWAAVFDGAKGEVQVFEGAKTARTPTLTLAPLDEEGAVATQITAYSAERARGRESGVAVRAAFAAGKARPRATFMLRPDGTMEIKPDAEMPTLRIRADLAHAIVPAAPLEDLIHATSRRLQRQTHLPSENVFVGLLKGESKLFTCAWPPGKQRASIIWDARRRQHALEIHLAGRPVFLKGAGAPGIWYEEDLSKVELGEDYVSRWKPPFEARWKTQLMEADFETTFPFGDSRRRTWRPNFGFYSYPVWIEQGEAKFHLSKKVSSSGRTLIYALEGHEAMPLDFARKHVPNVPAVQKRRSLQRYPENNVGLRNCDGRAWTKWAFRAGIHAREGDLLKEGFKDFLFSIKGDKGRLEEYPPFIDGLAKQIAAWRDAEKTNARARAYLGRVAKRLPPLQTEFTEMMHGRTPAEQLTHEIKCLERLTELAGDHSPDTYAEACYLLDELQLWSLIEGIPARVGGMMRVLHVDAGRWCADNPGAVKYAEKIRRDLREFLINDETHETIY